MPLSSEMFCGANYDGAELLAGATIMQFKHLQSAATELCR